MADIIIPLTIPSAHAAKALDALSGLAGKHIQIDVSGHNFNGQWHYKYEPKQSGETNKEFAIRAIKENVKALLRLHDKTIDDNRYSAEIAAINQPSQDVPDDIIT